MSATDERFYIRYCIGHKGKFGTEYLEFKIDDSGRLTYINTSDYKREIYIFKELYLSRHLLDEIMNIVRESDIVNQNDENWPKPDFTGKQEIEIVDGQYHISFVTTKIGSLSEIETSRDPDGLKKLHFLVLDLKSIVFDIISLHLRVFIF
ncbi:hypothetical protein MHBO_002913 [Bonamia ostreae]|uniref:Mago nashi n=1 Tax=Bonamia ostreae TaxID=126728 RepID=A0ABV2ANX9_9EUKA